MPDHQDAINDLLTLVLWLHSPPIQNTGEVTPVDDDIEEEDLLPHARQSGPKQLTSAGLAAMAMTAVSLLPKHWREATSVDNRIEKEDLLDDQQQQASRGQVTKGAVKEPDASSTDSEESREDEPHPKRQHHAIQLGNKYNDSSCKKCKLSADMTVKRLCMNLHFFHGLVSAMNMILGHYHLIILLELMV